ncbi:hemolymph juvenile hormone-binding protein [Oryctes borbonicus]|uniref:Hemolymph juvenile hormone-binding protein n=1 Tax=Oryctes borbonicus TaxID=1629725 RepID=A0A0T6B9L6_9SCAR|nr:hemolymph juvenile hormone-binding protein [Oryctes borbonicus]
MCINVLGIFLIIVGTAVFVVEGVIPDYIHVCSATDADISKCILNSIALLRPQLEKGIKELDVPPLEPLPLDEITLKRGPTSTSITANITDIKVWGASKFEIQELRANVRKNKFNFRVRLPYLYFQGKYDLDMQILLIKLRGKGPITGNFSNYECEAVMKGTKIQRDGEEYLRFDKMKVKIFVGEAKLNLENLFGGDPILGRVSNDILSQNSELFLNEIRPNLEASLAEKFTDIANKITLRFTYNELFP